MQGVIWSFHVAYMKRVPCNSMAEGVGPHECGRKRIHALWFCAVHDCETGLQTPPHDVDIFFRTNSNVGCCVRIKICVCSGPTHG